MTDDVNATATAEATPADSEVEAPPEPLTPERVSEWNAYYDVYVRLATLLLAFVVGCNYLTDSQIWAHLKAGDVIAQNGSPLQADQFTYTEEGKPWNNVPWLFQLSQSALYKFAYGMVPTRAADPSANRAQADQIAIGTLIIVNALLRLLTALLILSIRRAGPGLWWSAICVTVALGTVLYPVVGLVMGGIAGTPSVSPSTGGLFLFALELNLLYQVFGRGRSAMLWLLVPTFLVWANWDSSFLTGLILLVSVVAGRLIDGKRLTAYVPLAERSSGRDNSEASSSFSAPGGLIAGVVTLVCALVTLVNPSTFHAYEIALHPFATLFQPASEFQSSALFSFFGKGLQKQYPNEWFYVTAYYVLVVGAGLFSFLLNSRNFRFTRFLPFAVLAAIWAVFMGYSPEFALVSAVVIALNGQEWYQDRFGTAGRLGFGWSLWSTGGRLVTLALIFAFVSIDITGWRNSVAAARFGLGYDPNDFPFDATEFLQLHPEIKGNVLNTSMSQGDLLIWKSFPNRKTYIDSRQTFFPRELFDEWHTIRVALRDDDIATWKPILDKHNISVVMIEPVSSNQTYRQLMQSPNWIPFHDDGRIVLFGRADAKGDELAVFKSNRLDPDLRAFKTTRPVPSVESPPTPSTWIDGIFMNRTLGRPQNRTDSARRWLAGLSSTPDAIPDPSRCLLAIQDARAALARNPDDWLAYRVLVLAYRLLMFQESALLQGIPLTPENTARINRLNPSAENMMDRFRQRVTALNFAIMTTPPPQSVPERVELINLNIELFQLYLSVNALDLARDRLKAALDISQPEDFATETRLRFQDQLGQLDQRVTQISGNLDELAIERQQGPLEQAGYALRSGATGIAINQLSDAERNGMSSAVVKPQLIDIFCNTGQPDKALELLTLGQVDDPNLGSEPGAAAMRQGLVYFLLGNYLSAASLWQERALPKVRFERSNRLLTAGQMLLRGEAMSVVNGFMTLPQSLGQQATWTYQLAMCQLEAGLPDLAATSFLKALELVPEMTVRPIIVYYLEKMGKAVPPAPEKKAGTTAGTPSPSPRRPAGPGVALPPAASALPRPAASSVSPPAASPGTSTPK